MANCLMSDISLLFMISGYLLKYASFRIPSFLIFEFKVLAFSPRISAAPLAPKTLPLHHLNTFNMYSEYSSLLFNNYLFNRTYLKLRLNETTSDFKSVF